MPRSAMVAATLSFVWPGLGQWYAKRPRAAFAYGIPILVLAGLLILALLDGLTVFAVRLLDPTISLTILILIVLAGGWRVLSIVDAARAARSSDTNPGRTRGLVVALVVVAIAVHALAASYTYSFFAAGSKIFVGNGPNASAQPSTDASPKPSDDYNVPPFATPGTAEGRITVLLTGIDKTEERTASNTDTILLLTIDPVSHAIAMISFPRDISSFPLYLGGTYEGKINSLMAAAAANPTKYPDGPLPTLVAEISYLLGVPIHYFAAVDIEGFQKMITAVDGVDVDVVEPINDPLYDWLDGSPQGFALKAGPQHLNPRIALAFVRSRQGAGDNDFKRAARQQQLLVALRQKMTDPANLGMLPAVLDAVGDTIRTNFPADRLDEMVDLAQQIGDGATQRVVLQPPTYTFHPATSSTGGIYTLRLKLEAVRALSVQIFGKDSAFWSGTFDPGGSPIPLAP